MVIMNLKALNNITSKLLTVKLENHKDKLTNIETLAIIIKLSKMGKLSRKNKYI